MFFAPLYLLVLAPLATLATPIMPKTVAPAPAPLLVAAAKGTQNYVCDPSQKKWLLTGADAALTDASGKEIGVHFFTDAVPHWKLFADDSFIATRTIFAIPSPDLNPPQDGKPAPAKNIPWLSTRKIDCSDHGLLSEANYVARTDTHGGVAPPADTCTEYGAEQKVAYAANYYFGK